MADLEVPQAAVEAVLTHQWRAGDRQTEHDRHGYSEDCAVCQEWVPAILAVAAPHIAAAALRQAAEEHQPVASPGAIGIGAEPDIPPGAIRCSLCDRPYPCPPYVRLRELANDLVPPTPDTREGILAAAGLTEADMQERADG